jgi:hypothetical protein
MKSSKWMIGLTAIVLMLALAPSSFAQIQILINNTPSSGEITTARHANTADVTSPGAGVLVSGSLIASSTLTTTDLTLTFPAPITSGATALSRTGTVTNVPSAADGIRIEGATGLFAAVSAVATVNYSAGTITVVLPGFPPPTGNVGQSGSFRITGVRLDINGKSAPLAITNAQLSSSANNYLPPTSLPTLISSVGAGLASFAGGTASGGTSLGTATIFANQSSGTPADATASVVLTEGFASAWRTATQNATTGSGPDITNGSNILLTIAGLPSGITATLSRVVIAANTNPGIALTSSALTSAATTTTISFTSTDLSSVESLAFDVILSYTGAVTVPVTATSFTLSAKMTPDTASSVISGGVPTAGVVKFNTASLGPVTISTTIQNTSSLLLPYFAKTSSGSVVYETGVAVSNTTKDPFTTGSATAASGTARVDLFPRAGGAAGGAGTQTTIQTSASVRPGAGLDASGNIVGGSTWTFTIGDLLAAASPAVTVDATTGYIGYAFLQTNFVDAHGLAYLLENGRVVGTVPLLVVPPPATTNRNTAGAESLSF